MLLLEGGRRLLVPWPHPHFPIFRGCLFFKSSSTFLCCRLAGSLACDCLSLGRLLVVRAIHPSSLGGLTHKEAPCKFYVPYAERRRRQRERAPRRISPEHAAEEDRSLFYSRAKQSLITPNFESLPPCGFRASVYSIPHCNFFFSFWTQEPGTVS